MRTIPIHTSGQCSCQTESRDGQNRDVWIYSETSNRTMMGALLFGAFIAGIAVLVVGSTLKEKLPFVLLFLVLVAVMLWFWKRGTTVVINRQDATIRKAERSLIFSRLRTYSLPDYTAAALKEHVRTGEEGYLMADYLLVLQGAGRSLTILSTDDGEEAKRLQQEVRSYLERGPEGVPVGH